MTHRAQTIANFLRDALFQEDLGVENISLVVGVVGRTGSDAESRGVQGVLSVLVVVDHIEEDLDVTLRLHETAHDTVDYS